LVFGSISLPNGLNFPFNTGFFILLITGKYNLDHVCYFAFISISGITPSILSTNHLSPLPSVLAASSMEALLNTIKLLQPISDKYLNNLFQGQ